MTDPPRRGRFVTVEGIEGSGKSTQLVRLAERLRHAGIEPLLTREPGATSRGRELRGLLLSPRGPALPPLAELLLYAADRVLHLEEVVLPALARNEFVLCDRYVDATLAYQGFGRGLELERIRALHRQPPLDLVPDRTVLLDLDAEIGLGRARDRERRSEARADRFEQEELGFHRRVREGYLALARAEPARIRVVDGDAAADEVERRICAALGELWPPGAGGSGGS